MDEYEVLKLELAMLKLDIETKNGEKQSEQLASILHGSLAKVFCWVSWASLGSGLPCYLTLDCGQQPLQLRG